MARTRWMTAAWSRWRRAAKLNSAWIAASRALRVRTPLPRSFSRWSRNAPTSVASRSVISRRAGCFPDWRGGEGRGRRGGGRGGGGGGGGGLRLRGGGGGGETE